MTSYPDTKMKVVSYLLPISEAIKNKDDENKNFDPEEKYKGRCPR